MPIIDVNTIAEESADAEFNTFVKNFQTNIKNLSSREKYSQIQQNKDYSLDMDGYIIGDVWTETICFELISMNDFVPNAERLETLLLAREIYKDSTVPSNHEVVAKTLEKTTKEFLKMFPKFPIVYFTRWGGMRKPRNLAELLANPIKTR